MDHLTPNPALYNVPFRTTEFHGMPYRRLGDSGLQVSNIGLGTWKIGLPETGDGSRVDEKTAFALFDRAVELGVTFWDTANRYNAGSGNSERVIGRWLRRNPEQRRNIVIATKVYGGMDGYTPNHGGLSRLNIIASVDACLKRLQTDYIDVLYFHAFDPETPIEESLAAVEDLVRQGAVRYFAVSNFTVEQLTAYKEAERKLSVRCRVIAVQNQFDPLHGEAADRPGVLEYAARNGIAFVPWSPLARGLLTDRYIDPTKIGPGDRLFDEGDWKDILTDGVVAKLRRLSELAHEWGMELSQLALAYMLTIPGMGPLIPSSSSVRQLESNAAAGKMKLEEEQLARIRAIFGI
jgi:aryl-alcohol dehydrogenase-like predicted oxidoreductase